MPVVVKRQVLTVSSHETVETQQVLFADTVDDTPVVSQRQVLLVPVKTPQTATIPTRPKEG